MDKYIKVAEHVFLLRMPSSHPLWDRLDQYEPFVTDAVREPVFTLELVESLPETEFVKVYGGGEGPGEPVVMLYIAGDAWGFEMAVYSGQPFAARVISNNDFSFARMQILSDRFSLFGLNNALMLMYAFRTAGMGTLEMHASVIVNGGKAFLWLASSGTGKSTHSRLWLEYVPGSHLLNDDNPIVRLREDGGVEVYGSPWSGKTPCYIIKHFPLGAFVQIRRSQENRISRQSIVEAYATVYSSSSGYKSDPKMADELHSTFEKIALGCPFYYLDCRPDREAAEVCSKELLAL